MDVLLVTRRGGPRCESSEMVMAIGLVLLVKESLSVPMDEMCYVVLEYMESWDGLDSPRFPQPVPPIPKLLTMRSRGYLCA